MTKADELAAKLKQRLQGSDETEISTDTAIDHWPTQVNDLYLQIETWLAPLSEAGLGIRRNSTHVYERHPSGATYNYAVDQLLLEALDRTITFDPIARFSPKAEGLIEIHLTSKNYRILRSTDEHGESQWHLQKVPPLGQAAMAAVAWSEENLMWIVEEGLGL
ncbi:hypothetical protein QMK50_04575 [Pseudomonas sp. P5_152]|uniref:hypothetical protein n=1 Tax=Pseudomonas sp. P5_152 TaxID=3043442 RepID=UPI002A35A5FC|nr:hypothetical protein [Pseudomonas sp. P5_152]MDX9664246.1 hypothetical protein [Pseudomonas sp. P5_152]